MLTVYLCIAWACLAVPMGVWQTREIYRENRSVWLAVMFGWMFGLYSPIVCVGAAVYWLFANRGVTAALRRNADKHL